MKKPERNNFCSIEEFRLALSMGIYICYLFNRDEVNRANDRMGDAFSGYSFPSDDSNIVIASVIRQSQCN